MERETLMGRFFLCVGILSVLIEFVISTWMAARREWQEEARLEESP